MVRLYTDTVEYKLNLEICQGEDQDLYKLKVFENLSLV